MKTLPPSEYPLAAVLGFNVVKRYQVPGFRGAMGRVLKAVSPEKPGLLALKIVMPLAGHLAAPATDAPGGVNEHSLHGPSFKSLSKNANCGVVLQNQFRHIH